MAFDYEFVKSAKLLFFFIGSANAEKGLDAPHHHPRFDIDEEVLPRAAALMTASALEFLKA